MSVLRIRVLLAAAACCLAPSSACWAQAYGAAHFVEHANLNWFEPMELDLDGTDKWGAERPGYFGHYDKLYWNFSGERVAVGDPGRTVQSEQIYAPGTDASARFELELLALRGFTPEEIEEQTDYLLERDGGGNFVTTNLQIVDDDGNVVGTVQLPQLDPTDADGNGKLDTVENQVPQTYAVENGIQDATPDAEFAWGDRYEFGYTDGERGWMIGVLAGPEAVSEGVFGAGEDHPFDSQGALDPPFNSDNPGTDPFYEDGDVDGNQNGLGDGDGQVGEQLAFGFGSVAVNFRLNSPDLLTGYRDYTDNVGRNIVGTQAGPIRYVGNYGAPAVDSDLDEDDPEFEFENGLADDYDNDGIAAVTYLVAENADGDEEVIAVILDYGDLYDFNVFFDEVTTRNVTRVDGVEWMLTHNLERGHKLEQGRRDKLELNYGVRFLRLQDEFFMQGLGSVLGRTTIDQAIDNQIVGPQIGLRWVRNRGLWDFMVSGRFMFGYNIIDADHNGLLAEEAIPGAVNRSASYRTTTVVEGARFDDFSPVGELRVEARYKFSKGISFLLGYNAQFVDNVRRASQTIDYALPTTGIVDNKTDILINGLNMGVEVRF